MNGKYPGNCRVEAERVDNGNEPHVVFQKLFIMMHRRLMKTAREGGDKGRIDCQLASMQEAESGIKRGNGG